MDNFIGKKIEQFLIESFVGKGKTGSVYQARDLNLDRSVAIKLLSPELAIHPGIQRQLAQAARNVSSLTHPSIVTLYNLGNQNGRAYLVTDFVNGISLDKALLRLNSRSQFMPLHEVLHIMAQAADALSAAHQAGALHLNLKPSNILIKRQQRPSRPGDFSLRAMLTDFGLALIPETGIQTAFIDLHSNYAYLAPEQCTNGAVDGRTDVYSLGIVLYELLTGRVPFAVQSPTEAIMRHSVESPLPVRDLRPDVPPAVTNVVYTALAKDPAKRFQIAEQMADALRQAGEALLVTENGIAIRPSVPARTRTLAELTGRHKNGLGKETTAVQTEPPTPPESTLPPARQPIFNSPVLALSETMPVQPQFDTPVFNVVAHDVDIQVNHIPETAPAAGLGQAEVPPFTVPFNEAVPAQPTPPYAMPVAATAAVADAPTDVHVLDVPPEAAQIVIIRQGRGPRRATLNKPQILIGRAKDNDIVLNARDVSRYHARLDWVNGRWRITDLDSSAGTFGDGHRLSVNEPESWLPGQIMQIGSYFLHWAAATELETTANVVNEEPKTELFQVAQDTSQVQSTSGHFCVALHPALLTMMAGDQTTVQVELFNQGPATDTLKLAINGLPSGIYSLTQHFLTLAPGARANIPLVLQLPTTGTLMSYRIAAGNYPFELLVHSKTNEAETAVIAGMLIVTTQEHFSLNLWPTQIDDGDNIRILLRNEGNVPNIYSLVGRDEKSLVQFGGQRGRMQLRPGEAITQVVTVRTRQRPLFGREQLLPFEVEVRTENGQQQVKAGQIRVQPQVPRWAVWLSTAIFVLLLGVLLVTAVITQGQVQWQSPAPTDVTPASQPLTDSLHTSPF
ncbi:MAG: protein kinase [Anaerolineae bacterium]|nr:protein kinase [Anaerolineae bacterium]